MDNAQMVEGCRRRDAKAQRALYDAMAPMVMGVCMRYANDRSEAQDMLQDGFLKVFERIGSLGDSERLVSWVYNLTVNTCIDHCRRRRKWLSLEGEEVEVPSIDFYPYAAEEVINAMQQLSPMQRTVFNLCEVEGYELDEVAERLHSTNLNVRVALSRAKKILREILTGSYTRQRQRRSNEKDIR